MEETVNTAPTFFVPLLPFVWAAIGTTIWWKKLPSRWTFLIIGTFALLGIDHVISVVWDLSKVFSGVGLTGAPISATALALMLKEQNWIAEVRGALVFSVAVPLLHFLKRGLCCESGSHA
jgi:hypothetical protein